MIGALRASLLIAGRDTRARLRNRAAIVTAFLAPLALSGILSLALGGTSGFTTTMGVVVLDEGPVGAALLEVLESGDLADTIAVMRFADEEALRAALLADEVSAGLVVPEGASAAARAQARGSEALRVLRVPGAPLSGDLVEGLAAAFVGRLDAAGRAVATAVAAGADPASIGDVGAVAAALEPAVVLDTGGPALARRSVASYYGPAMAVFFVFFVVAFGPRSLLDERAQGTLARLHAAPIPPWAILAGKAVGVFALALASIATMWLVTSLALDADWGDPLGVTLVAVAFVTAATGITALIATLARTQAQADGVTNVVVFLFAILGGSFVQLEDLPEAVQRLALATPNGWAMRAFSDLSAGAGALDVLPAIGVMLLFATVAAALSAPRVDRILQPAGSA